MTASRSSSVALGLATRSARKLSRNPGVALSPMLVPTFTFIAFVGALSSLADTKGFDYYDFTAFEFVFVLYTAAAFAGAFSSFEILFDFQSGMGRRLMLSTPRRFAMIGGYLVTAIGRGLLAIVVIWGVALVLGMPVRGGPVDIAAVVALALLLNIAAFLYGAGLALRLQVMAAGTLVFIPTFIAIFLTPVFTPRDTLDGWLKTAATVNPLTPAVEAGRGFLANEPVSVGLSFGVAAGLVIFFALWALRGMRSAEKRG
jgi:ABC-2 type transport system permease protein